MKKLTPNCDYPTLTLSIILLVFDIIALTYYFATTDKVEWGGVMNSLFWMVWPVILIIGLYKEGTKE